jgi:hypothetical protein
MSSSASPQNRPGLSSLSYRVATHADFKEEMLARISAQPALRPLSTRDDDDPVIALMDAWATTLDVLTFYQERIANEGFLRTATERRSVMELARAIGYPMRPGLAASTWLAFTIEDAPGSPREVAIPRGTRAQSMPAREELPQPFETDEPLVARAAWNELRPRTLQRQSVRQGSTELLLRGVATQLQPGDPILLVGGRRQIYPGAEQWDFRILTEVEPRPLEGITRIVWTPGIGDTPPTVLPDAFPRVYALRQRAALFGFNAPDPRALPDNIRSRYSIGDNGWPGFSIQNAQQKMIDLDAVYPRILPGSWVVLRRPAYTELYRVTSHETTSRTDYTVTAKISRLTLDTLENLSMFGLRDTVVYAQSEELEVAEAPVTEPVTGASIVLDRKIEGLVPGRRLIVRGVPAGSPAGTPPAVEAVILSHVTEEDGVTRLTLQQPLAGAWDCASTVLLGNVAPATQGETQSEVLGSGDSSQAFQRFRLSRGPLTYLQGPDGTDRSTLEVRVSGVLWTEVPSLAAAGPRDRVYTLERDERGMTSLQFGDGRHGARLPSGIENVTAVYRVGLGSAGLVETDRITILTTRPMGVRSVTNPAPADGGIDPESRDEARGNTPAAVLTLGRAVTLSDHEGFARSFTGVARARASWQIEAGRKTILLTLAPAAGVDGPALARSLTAALDRIRDPYQPLRVMIDPSILEEVVP